MQLLSGVEYEQSEHYRAYISGTGERSDAGFSGSLILLNWLYVVIGKRSLDNILS